MSGRSRVLYHLLCAAPPALDAATFVQLAQAASWDVCVLATPRAAGWLDVASLEEITGHPVRSDYKRIGEPDVLPPPDAIVVAPATFNTVNKWAAGIADTLVLGLLTEALGLGRPVVAAPHVNAAQCAHPAYGHSLDVLEGAGVGIVEVPPFDPGDALPEGFPWWAVLAGLDATVAARHGGQSPNN